VAAELLRNMPVQIIEEPVNKAVKAKRVLKDSAAVVASSTAPLALLASTATGAQLKW
jgi:hypothetical protein